MAGKAVGRPTLYSEELVERICIELMDGKSLVKICDAEDMPHRVTVVRWLSEHRDFATKYAHARDTQADLMDDMILDVANASTSETAIADRVRIAAYQWRASKLLPKKYGNKVTTELSGPNGSPIQVDITKATEDQLAALEAFFGPLAESSPDDEGDQSGESASG